MSTSIGLITINGEPASEFVLHSYAAATYGVPVVFVSGDERLCADAMAFNPGIRSLAVSRGVGHSTISLAPKLAHRLIREGVEAALKRDLSVARIALPGQFSVEITFNVPIKAYRASWYPGARSIGDNIVRLDADNFLDIMRMLKFVL